MALRREAPASQLNITLVTVVQIYCVQCKLSEAQGSFSCCLALRKVKEASRGAFFQEVDFRRWFDRRHRPDNRRGA
jgi:hypothetical protein